jgi:hypothetical protein
VNDRAPAVEANPIEADRLLGSDGIAMEVVGNVFEDIARHAIVIEGDSNRVSLSTDPAEAVRRLTDRLIAAWNDDFPVVVKRFYAGEDIASPAPLPSAGRGPILEAREREGVCGARRC